MLLKIFNLFDQQKMLIWLTIVKCSVADPSIFYTDPGSDPDPALFSIYGYGYGYGSGSGSRLFDDTKISFQIFQKKSPVYFIFLLIMKEFL